MTYAPTDEKLRRPLSAGARLSMMEVPVFISYHSPDYAIAEALKTSLEALSAKFKVFVDKTSIAPGDDFRKDIKAALSKAQWLLIVCIGFPRPNADMAWSFFEAGQFSATLPRELEGEASKRMVCLYDKEAPSVLSPLQGVKVTNRQISGAQIDLAMHPSKHNTQYDETFIYTLFRDMLNNAPLMPLRDTEEESVKEDIREQCQVMIELFEAAGSSFPIADRSLQPRISYEIKLNETLQGASVISGYEGSLNELFSVSKQISTWGDITKPHVDPKHPRPLWIQDIESDAALIAKDLVPDRAATKCVLKGKVYRSFTSRVEEFKDNRRIVYVGFLPAVPRAFDLRRNSAIILSALILSFRFRQQMIPMIQDFIEADDIDAALEDFYRRLQAIEMEAVQFGLDVKIDSGGEPAVVGAVQDHGRRLLIDRGIKDWTKKRKEIDKIFDKSKTEVVESQASVSVLTTILQDIEPKNAEFILALAEELLAEVRRESVK